ncbi:hypothetical protein CXB51_027506 [Gossypium anomalum]|uniref:Reverse transcriptase domain-containing protein n=1 Tax=Gossypium anomalum TaxID=47600 RepID=A0A8J6CMK9_9ROSI|nr:hypothetical protein CXB51_027506 [Gossypium anomalum]
MEKKLGKRPVSEESPPKSLPPKQVSKSLMIQGDQNPLTKFLKDYTESTIPKISTVQDIKSSESSSDTIEFSESSAETIEFSDLEDEELQKAFQTTKVEEPSDDEMQDIPESSFAQQRKMPKSSIGRTTFTLDDLPPAKWPDRIQEFHSWLETRKLTEDSNYSILMGLNPNLKPVILSSLLNPIQVAVNQALQTQNKDILHITKQAKKIAQIIRKSGVQIQEEDDIESVCSIEDKPSDRTICAIPTYDSSESESDYSDMQMIQAKAQSVDNTVDKVSVPHIPVKVYLDKYSKPITVIAFIDTGAAETIMNPDALPSEWWKPHIRFFDSAVNVSFATHLISKPITIQFFPGYCVKTIVLGSKLPEKDIVVESHSEFLNKCPNPLWKNLDFFIHLTFKKNEDINPTKASHQGMNPDHQILAEKECRELQQQDLIKPSDSQWACEAFYVNKKSEQIRGNLRLVINYQLLNHFLQDDKFPLPKKDLFFSSLAKARVFSKFDLKASFWQLGIHPKDRPKTGFCIPNGHFQWKVMPFGLNTAPSLFQEAMIKIFHPLMENALVYIDDILLYSKDEDSHAQLLDDFKSLISNYRIMLSEKKMQINKTKIQFLGMDIKEGKYSPQPHIAQELLKFPTRDLFFKQVEQFIGIVNYLRDFIPKFSNDKYWGAILLEKVNGKKQLCGYKSGRFSEAEIHYHSIFKEILAVKKDIDAPWGTCPRTYTPYHKGILKALREYYEGIPDPTEWSQDYPWQYSQISLAKIDLHDEKGQDKEMTCYSEDSMDSAQLRHSNTNS